MLLIAIYLRLDLAVFVPAACSERASDVVCVRVYFCACLPAAIARLRLEKPRFTSWLMPMGVGLFN